MTLEVLFLFKCLVATWEGALKLAFMAFEVPVKFALTDELLIWADWALEF